MARVEMTKAEVIEAIRGENLVAGEWVSEYESAKATAECCFCAVGSVVRRAMSDEATTTQIANGAQAHGWKDGPLHALSDAFESAALEMADSDDEGDLIYDTDALEAGRAAGMTCVAVLTGLATRDDLAAHADIVLADIGALPRWIEGG